jgi:hypothetical protein
VQSVIESSRVLARAAPFIIYGDAIIHRPAVCARKTQDPTTRRTLSVSCRMDAADLAQTTRSYALRVLTVFR